MNGNCDQKMLLLKYLILLSTCHLISILAFGSIISFGSYNSPHTNCVRDVKLLSACNAFTAVYACAVIFAILGFKAKHLFDKCLHR